MEGGCDTRQSAGTQGHLQPQSLVLRGPEYHPSQTSCPLRWVSRRPAPPAPREFSWSGILCSVPET